MIEMNPVERQRRFQSLNAYFAKLLAVASNQPHEGAGWFLESDGVLNLYGPIPRWDPAARMHGDGGTVGYVSHTPWSASAPLIRTVCVHPGARVDTLSGAFANCTALIEVDGLERLDVSRVTSADAMFAGCGSLVAIDLGGVLAPCLRSARHMFHACHELAFVRFGEGIMPCLETVQGMFEDAVRLRRVVARGVCPQLRTVSGMFRGCSTLVAAELGELRMPEVVSLSFMFERCELLQRVDLSGCAGAHPAELFAMFLGCASLLDADLSCFDGARAHNMDMMFAGCAALERLDLSCFDEAACARASHIFDGVPRTCRVVLRGN